MPPVFKCKITMNGIKVILTALLLSLTTGAFAQKVAVSTNLIEWADFITPNASVQYAAGQHLSLEAAARYNCWSWRTGGTFEERQVNEIKSRQQAYSLGVRWWPWNVYSGWWVAARLQYQEYDYGGLSMMKWIPDNEAGDAFGAVLLAGYALQVHKHWDVEFGLGFWGGYKTYTVYSCPWCGRIVDKGAKTFVLPDQAMISLVYIF